MEIELLNGKYIGFPCTPSVWTREPEYKKITVIIVSCGGGMGGSKWREYVYRTDELPKGIQWYRTVDGRDIRLNSNNIVMMEDYTMVTVYYRTSNQKISPGGAERSKSFLIDDDMKVELINVYSDTTKRMNHNWLKEQRLI